MADAAKMECRQARLGECPESPGQLAQAILGNSPCIGGRMHRQDDVHFKEVAADFS
jgi:hypothetical protein